MLTVKEENDIAIAKMRERFQDTLNKPVKMALRDLVAFSQAVGEFTNHREVESYAQLTCFLMQNLGYDYPDAPVILRYKTLNGVKGIEEALSDWDNRYEMGK